MPLQEPEPHSITRCLEELQGSSESASHELWRRYFDKLVRLAKGHLRHVPKRVSDEEDVAICVFRSLCEGVEQGRFDQLGDREDLWKLLVVLTRHKSLNQIRQQAAQKRGGLKVRGESVVEGGIEDRGLGLDLLLGSDPTPDFLVAVEEERERLLNALTDDRHRQIALLRWQGYALDEIAEQLVMSTRSVKRKLALIREIWLASH